MYFFSRENLSGSGFELMTSHSVAVDLLRFSTQLWPMDEELYGCYKACYQHHYTNIIYNNYYTYGTERDEHS